MKLNIEEIIELYKNTNLSVSCISKKYDVTRHTIAKILFDNKIKIDRSRSGLDPNFKSYFFEKIDSEEKAYILGFFYADGHINSIGNAFWISLHEQDKEILEKFKKILNINRELRFHKGSICKFKNNKNKIYYRGNQYRLTITNKKIADALRIHGMHNNKSFSIQFPNIESKLIRHFIRGFFDGDGSIYKAKEGFGFQISAPFQFNKPIQNFFKEKNIDIPIFTITKYSKAFSNLRSHGNLKTLKIMNILYENATIYLERKYNKYLELKNIVFQKYNN